MPLTAVIPSAPPWHLLNFPPLSDPATLSPPVHAFSLLTPFNIPPTVYNDLLSVWWPITIATVYASTVYLLNDYNRARKNKPWAISRTSLFTTFVITHNILLALYSAWTFVGMLRAVTAAWPGHVYDDQFGFAPLADALCKIQGPRGLGSAATYDPYRQMWSSKDRFVKLLDGTPDSTDRGRLWNEGVAYYGWLFYLSKFYEVVDTFIILAKGKRSSLLQTYHHAGAMFCLWAGIRYMSTPIWLFVQFNSGIHALMYTYYTIAALGYRVPNRIKQVLTTMQISQFVIGVAYATSHFFISYEIPVVRPYLAAQEMASSASSALPSASSILSSAVASATVGMSTWLKKLALRAAQHEGLAENVRDSMGNRFGIDAVHADSSDVYRAAQQEVRYRTEYPTVHCVDTSGQAFAIWLNVAYLAPLTFLFADFFVKSYMKRGQSAKERDEPSFAKVVRSGSDAAAGVEREVWKAMGDQQGWNGELPSANANNNNNNKEENGRTGSAIADDHDHNPDEEDTLAEVAAKIEAEVRKDVKGVAEAAEKIGGEVRKDVKGLADAAKTLAAKAAEKGEAVMRDVRPKKEDREGDSMPGSFADAKKSADKGASQVGQVGQGVQDAAKEGKKDGKKEAADATDKATDTAGKASEKAAEGGDAAKQAAEKPSSTGAKAPEKPEKPENKSRDSTDPTRSSPTENKGADDMSRGSGEGADGVGAQRPSSPSKAADPSRKLPSKIPSKKEKGRSSRSSSPVKRGQAVASTPAANLAAKDEKGKDKKGKEKEKASGSGGDKSDDKTNADSAKKDGEGDDGEDQKDELAESGVQVDREAAQALEVNLSEAMSEGEKRAEKEMNEPGAGTDDAKRDGGKKDGKGGQLFG